MHNIYKLDWHKPYREMLAVTLFYHKIIYAELEDGLLFVFRTISSTTQYSIITVCKLIHLYGTSIVIYNIN